MENFVLSCCSTADLSLEHFQNRNIHYICFHYELNGTVYPDDLGQSMPFDVFYEAMTRGAETKTFQVNVAEFEAYFESFLKEGKDILHLCLSSGITGVMNSANIAKDILAEKYPEKSRDLLVKLLDKSMAGANSRDNYRGVIARLKRLNAYPDGKDAARGLAGKWRIQYSSRRAMIDELNKAKY